MIPFSSQRTQSMVLFQKNAVLPALHKSCRTQKGKHQKKSHFQQLLNRVLHAHCCGGRRCSESTKPGETGYEAWIARHGDNRFKRLSLNVFVFTTRKRKYIILLEFFPPSLSLFKAKDMLRKWQKSSNRGCEKSELGLLSPCCLQNSNHAEPTLRAPCLFVLESVNDDKVEWPVVTHHVL